MGIDRQTNLFVPSRNKLMHPGFCFKSFERIIVFQTNFFGIELQKIARFVDDVIDWSSREVKLPIFFRPNFMAKIMRSTVGTGVHTSKMRHEDFTVPLADAGDGLKIVPAIRSHPDRCDHLPGNIGIIFGIQNLIGGPVDRPLGGDINAIRMYVFLTSGNVRTAESGPNMRILRFDVAC